MTTPRISVIIPAYGHGGLILETLDSVFAQTFTDHEIIVVNDGSPDDTADRLRPLAEAGRIRYFEQTNQGQAGARNRGLAEARGEFIAYLDDDDLWPPDKLAWQLRWLEEHRCDVVVGNVSYLGGKDFVPTWAEEGEVLDYHSFFGGNPIISPGQALIRRRVLDKIGPWDGRFRGSDDLDLWFRLARETPLWVTARVALVYRLHARNASKNVERMAVNVWAVLARHLQDLPPGERAACRRRAAEYLQGYLGVRLVRGTATALRRRQFVLAGRDDPGNGSVPGKRVARPSYAPAFPARLLSGLGTSGVKRLDTSISPRDAMIFLYSDLLVRAGGIETYLHALASRLRAEKRPFRVAVAELEPCVAVDELVGAGVEVYRQRRLPGDRWLVRQRALMWWLSRQLRRGDWVFCVRQPMPELHGALVRLVHRRGARLAVSWMLPPADVIPPARYRALAGAAVAATDAVISTHHATLGQYPEVFGYEGPVAVVPYHNLPSFTAVVPMPPGPPWKIGFMGRLDIRQKNLDILLQSFARLRQTGVPVELHLHGGGADEVKLRAMAAELGLEENAVIWFHGFFNHQRDLPRVVASNHFFVYASRYEGLPLTLLELLQAGRFCVASNVGGIPDLYADHPECGTLVEPGDVSNLGAALAAAVERIAAGRVDADAIRARYLSAFAMESAHRAWLSALELPPEPAPMR